MIENEQQIRLFLREQLSGIMRNKGGDYLEVGDGDNFFELGTLDSIDFVNLVSAIEDQFDLEIDFSESDPMELLSISGLTNYISGRTGAPIAK